MPKTEKEMEATYRADIIASNDEISKMDLNPDWTHLGDREIPKK